MCDCQSPKISKLPRQNAKRALHAAGIMSAVQVSHPYNLVKAASKAFNKLFLCPFSFDWHKLPGMREWITQSKQVRSVSKATPENRSLHILPLTALVALVADASAGRSWRPEADDVLHGIGAQQPEDLPHACQRRNGLLVAEFRCSSREGRARGR